MFDELSSVTLQFVGHDGDDVEVTLFGGPPHIRSKLRHALSDKETWDDARYDEEIGEDSTAAA